jgi:beta-mannosidase
MRVRSDAHGVTVEGSLRLRQVERWWPHTHGDQPLYEVFVDIDGHTHPLGKVGFRTLSVDQVDGAFRIAVNDQPIFVRGACWTPPDPVCPGGAGATSRAAPTSAHEHGPRARHDRL